MLNNTEIEYHNVVRVYGNHAALSICEERYCEAVAVYFNDGDDDINALEKSYELVQLARTIRSIVPENQPLLLTDYQLEDITK